MRPTSSSVSIPNSRTSENKNKSSINRRIPGTTAGLIGTDIRKCSRCQCENCLNEKKGILILKPGEKRLHICPFLNCRKLYGKTSHLKVQYFNTRLSFIKI